MQAVGVRERFNTFVERHDVAWELGMGVLALLWLALGLLGDQYGTLSPELSVLELGITVVFIAEFCSRFIAAHDHFRYLRRHWIDALALLPVVRGIRLLRLLRLLRLVRAFSGIYRAGMHVERLSRHRGFATLVSTWLTVMVLCSAWVFAAENGINGLISSPFDALWWGVSTITTVGYGDAVPITPEGKLGAMVLMVLGIGLFSAITAVITSYMLTTHSEGSSGASDVVDQLATLADLRRDGALSEQEFETAKARVLGGATSP